MSNEFDYLRRLSEKNIAKILELDVQSIAIRCELEHKRRGFALLNELASELSGLSDYKEIFISVARRINAALYMQRTVILTPEADGEYRVAITQGYPAASADAILNRRIKLPATMLDPVRPALVTSADLVTTANDGADESVPMAVRDALELPYLISSPVLVYDTVMAVLITGRTEEQPPYLTRLDRRDVETVQAVSIHLGTIMARGRLQAALELAEKNAHAKSVFLANMSHELRTPMTTIMGRLNSLAATELDDRQSEYVKQATHSSRILLSIINDIFDIASMDSVSATLKSETFNLRNLTQRTVETAKEWLENDSVALRMEISPAVPEMALGDALRIERVLSGLMGNAVKFTSHGEVTLKLSLQQDTADSFLARFEVHDTGIGISREKIETIFSPFTQADSSFSRQYGGTGLGLAIAKRIVDLLGGQIGCESRSGKGSKFFFTVPLRHVNEQAETEKKMSASSAQTQTANDLEGMTVLLAEDNTVNQMIMGELLSAKGVSIDMVANGREVLDALAEKSYDAVLMDIQMPGMDGLETTRRIRKNPAFARLPIIAMTAHAMTADVTASLAAGMNDHITKPIDPPKLYETLARWRTPRS